MIEKIAKCDICKTPVTNLQASPDLMKFKPGTIIVNDVKISQGLSGTCWIGLHFCGLSCFKVWANEALSIEGDENVS